MNYNRKQNRHFIGQIFHYIQKSNINYLKSQYFILLSNCVARVIYLTTNISFSLLSETIGYKFLRAQYIAKMITMCKGIQLRSNVIFLTLSKAKHGHETNICVYLV